MVVEGAYRQGLLVGDTTEQTEVYTHREGEREGWWLKPISGVKERDA